MLSFTLQCQKIRKRVVSLRFNFCQNFNLSLYLFQNDPITFSDVTKLSRILFITEICVSITESFPKYDNILISTVRCLLIILGSVSRFP